MKTNIDVSPNWFEVVRIIRHAYTFGNDEAKRIADKSLNQMASICEVVRIAPKEDTVGKLFINK